MKTQGLNHIQISVSDIDRSLTFYTGLLGMRELFREGPLVFLQSAEGNDIFTLRQAEGHSGSFPVLLERTRNRDERNISQRLLGRVMPCYKECVRGVWESCRLPAAHQWPESRCL